MFARKINYDMEAKDNAKTNDSRKLSEPISYNDLMERIEHMQEIVFPALKERAELVMGNQKKKFDQKHKIIDFPE